MTDTSAFLKVHCEGVFMGHTWLTGLLIGSTVLFLFSGCTGKPELIEQKCSTCHTSALVYQHKRSAAEWDRLLYGMKVRGLKVTPHEEKAIRDILSRSYTE
jgi:hypothetical protein